MALACPHPGSPAVARVCEHLIRDPGGTFCRRFTGIARVYDLICPDCAEAVEELEETLGFVCGVCFAEVETRGVWDPNRPILGKPRVAEREVDVSFVHDMVRLPSRLRAPIVDFQPVQKMSKPLLVALLESGAIVHVNLHKETVRELGAVQVETGSDPALTISGDGKFAAVYARRGRHGVVLDLEGGRMSMTLDRGDDHIAETDFPVTFAEHHGRTVLIHATTATRLDISEPKSGQLLSQRDLSQHELGYVHGQLSASPSGKWLADSGWVEGPAGFVSAWSLAQWISDNPFESEDGPSKKYFDQRWYFWDGPMCWVGDGELAVWGYGPDESCLLPAVVLYDVDSGARRNWFPGPTGWLAFDDYLFSAHPEDGTSVWDIATGERIHHDRGFHPQRYHHGARAFLTTRPDGEFFVVSRLTSRG